jgi:hypothetical protein
MWIQETKAQRSLFKYLHNEKYSFFFDHMPVGVVVSGQDFEAVQLQQKLTQHPQQDTVRVNLLNTLAETLRYLPAKKDTIATEALALSQKTHYAIGEGYALVYPLGTKIAAGQPARSGTALQKQIPLQMQQAIRNYSSMCCWQNQI